MIYYSILLAFISYDLPSPPTIFALNDLNSNLDLISNPAILEALEYNIKKNKTLLKNSDIPYPAIYILNACILPNIKKIVHSSELLFKDPLPVVSEIWKNCIMNDDSICSISTNNSYINISSIWQSLLYIYNKMNDNINDKFINLCVEMFNAMNLRYKNTNTVNTDVFLCILFYY